MNTQNLTTGKDPNSIELIVGNIEIAPFAGMKNGIIEGGIIVKFGRYNLENLLCQVIEDYGQDKLIDVIKSL